jgi:hypothetical protein
LPLGSHVRLTQWVRLDQPTHFGPPASFTPLSLSRTLEP